MRIMVIDDDKDVREMICRMLIPEGYDVLDAENGDMGLKMIKNEPDVDLVITDLIMPEKEGLETIRELKQNYPQIKILAVSGGGKIVADSFLKIAKSLGADLTLSKPFVRHDLLQAVDELFEVH